LFRSEFYRRPQSVLNHRSFIAKRSARNKARYRYTALLYLVVATAHEPQILKFNSRCFAPKFRQNFTRRAAEFRSFIQSPACSRKTRAINFTPPLYDLVLSAQHFYSRLRRNDVSLDIAKILSPCSVEQAPLKFHLEARFQNFIKLTPYARLARRCVKFCRAMGSAIQISPAVSEVPPAR